jgi:hypothetical protein
MYQYANVNPKQNSASITEGGSIYCPRGSSSNGMVLIKNGLHKKQLQKGALEKRSCLSFE